MIWIRLLVGVIFFLLLLYYASVVMQNYGVIEFTKRPITFGKGLIPFYYWIASSTPKKVKKRVKPNNSK